MQSMGKYIYCFIGEEKRVDFGISSIGGTKAPVYTLPCGELAAVVSEAPVTDFSPTRKNILAHQSVLSEVMKRYTVIPVAFGTVSNGQKEIKAIIAENTQRFAGLLAYLKGRVELGLRVTWRKEAFLEDIANDEIRELNERIAGKKEEEIMAEKIELGKKVEASLLARREAYTEMIYEPLKKLAVDSKLKESVPMKTVFNAYFLVNEARSAEFDEKVEKIYGKLENWLEFSYTGPWPPYNFVDMNIRFAGD